MYKSDITLKILRIMFEILIEFTDYLHDILCTKESKDFFTSILVRIYRLDAMC